MKYMNMKYVCAVCESHLDVEVIVSTWTGSLQFRVVPCEVCLDAATADNDEDDICGLCGKPGADKIPHPIYWPNERQPATEFVHEACEDAECRRAHTALSDADRQAFLATIR